MILNFIWTIAISSVFPMLILLGMILGIEFANQLYYDNNSRTFDFCLRIIMYLIAFVLMVGFWALFINEFMTVEMKEAFPNFPMNFFYYIVFVNSMWYHMLYIIPYTGEVSNKDEKITCKNTESLYKICNDFFCNYRCSCNSCCIYNVFCDYQYLQSII